jgi:hypothetical protein
MNNPHLHPERVDDRDPKRLKENNKSEDGNPNESQPPPANPRANDLKKHKNARLLEFLPREERSDEEQKLTRGSNSCE